MKDSIILNQFGFLGNELAWGPVLQVDTTIFYDLNKMGSIYLTYNLIYVLKNHVTEPGINYTTYSVGVSGTNMISGYDWFAEDFDAAQAVPLQIKGKSYGNIASGSLKGYQILTSLRDDSGQSIHDFFTSAINNPANGNPALITVSGHSLGGALAPLLALDLKVNYPQVPVSTITFAGPSIGDQVYSDSVYNKMSLFMAYNNKHDAVPHCWKPEMINELCDLYPGQGFCKTLPNIPPAFTTPVQKIGGPLVDALVTYFKMKSSGQGYTQIGDPQIFEGELTGLDSAACQNLFLTSANFYNANAPSDHKHNGTETWYQIDSILNICKEPTYNRSQALESFFAFGMLMAESHTTAYFDFFIKDPALQKAVNLYVPAQDDLGLASDLAYALDISSKLLSDALTFLHQHEASIQTCKCN